MYHTLEEFFTDWQPERDKTARVFAALTGCGVPQTRPSWWAIPCALKWRKGKR